MENQLAPRRQDGAVSFPLEQSIRFTNQFISKNYLISLSSFPVIPLEEKYKKFGNIRLYRIDKLVVSAQDDINSKLTTVYNSLSSIGCTVLLVLDSDGSRMNYYIGIRSEDNPSTAGRILEKALLGNFPGSNLENMRNSQIEEILTAATAADFGNTEKSVAAVTVVPSRRGADENGTEQSAQGIETFIDTMSGLVYTAVIVSHPVDKELVTERKFGFQQMYTALSPHAKTTLSYGTSESQAVSEGLTQTTTHALTSSRGRAFGGSESVSSGSSYGSIVGGSSSSNQSTGSNWSDTMTTGTSDSSGSGSSRSSTDTQGSTKSLQVSHENKTVADMMERIDEQLERIRRCEAFGLWECAGYFVSQDIQTAVIAANTYKSLMTGEDSAVENSFVNLWSVKDTKNTAAALSYVRYGIHPLVVVSDPVTRERQAVTPTSMVSGNELPLLMGLPQKSVTGITNIKISEFGRNVFTQGIAALQRRYVDLGKVCHMGAEEQTPIRLNLESFTSHCFICGSTGSGKSNTSYRLIEELLRNDVKFMVIEPAKGEYRKEFGALPDVNVYTTNPSYFAMLSINPFEFEDGIHILEHLERLVEIFNACWPMFGALPAVLREGLETAYLRCGWDLANSVQVVTSGRRFPVFSDLLEALPDIIRKTSYSDQTKNEYTGALVTRIRSLTSGILGQIFCGLQSVPSQKLFDENTVIDISRVGSAETKSLIMGLLILKLGEYRTANAAEGNSPLRHVTILEEAHNILKRTSTTQSVDSANLAGKAVEMLSSSIAEMRTFGEGFIIIDQSPGAVDVSAIKNTNTKIIMRLPDEQDCIAVGKSASLTDEQIKELSRLGTGCAVVFQNNWLEPVMAKIHRSSGSHSSRDMVVTYEVDRNLRGKLAAELVRQHTDRQYRAEPLLELCEASGINRFKQEEWAHSLKFMTATLVRHPDDIKFYQTAISCVCNCGDLFTIYDIRFDYKAALQEPAPEEIKRQAVRWRTTICRAMETHLYLADKAVTAHLFRMMLAHRAAMTDSDSGKYKILKKLLQK